MKKGDVEALQALVESLRQSALVVTVAKKERREKEPASVLKQLDPFAPSNQEQEITMWQGWRLTG